MIKSIDQDWKFKQAGVDASKFLPVSQFPTNVHLDLLHHKLIPDPFIGKNESDVQWIGEKDWIYKTTFALPRSKARKCVLAFDGLDTYATVVLNGKEILKTENMFVPERVDVTDVVKEEDNDLVITFASTYLIGKKLVEKHPEHFWGCWNGDPSRLAVRKAQYHYGWDWGPALLTCGPWKQINFELYDTRISDLYIHTEVTIDDFVSSAKIVANANIEGEGSDIEFELSFEGRTVKVENVKVERGFATTTFQVQDPQLWYPASYGKQALYVLKTTLYSGKYRDDSNSKRFGLRKVKVVQKDLTDASGTSFYFEINDIPVFCGGSNWIPADSFLPRISREKYQKWVKLVRDGNQIMIRVWAGGVFEDENFYDACDEMGILVWQDFMFGCGNYPAYEEFLDSIKREASENVRLLRHHPSIVIWAGNNEDYQYRESENLDYDPKDTDPQNWLKSNFPARYIYEKILVDVTKELVPDTYYHFGSPFGGKDTRDATVGDIHQWNGIYLGPPFVTFLANGCFSVARVSGEVSKL